MVLRLARQNPHWGSRKIQGEMLKLGPKASRSTVVRLLLRHALGPPPDHRRSPTWSQFLGQYKDFIWAADFFTVTTARLRTFYVLFFMELRRRRLMLCNVTEYPHAEWVVQQLRNLSVQHDHLPRFILHDRDGKFSEEFDAFAQASGSKIIKLPARSPNLKLQRESALVPLALDSVISWQNIFGRLGFALCLCSSEGNSKSVELPCLVPAAPG